MLISFPMRLKKKKKKLLCLFSLLLWFRFGLNDAFKLFLTFVPFALQHQVVKTVQQLKQWNAK